MGENKHLRKKEDEVLTILQNEIAKKYDKLLKRRLNNEVTVSYEKKERRKVGILK